MSKLTIESLKAMGYDETGTGGGCTAFAKEWPNATVYITDDAATPDENTTVFQLGVQCHDTGFDLRLPAELFDVNAVEEGIPEADLFRCVGIAEFLAELHDPEGEPAKAKEYYV